MRYPNLDLLRIVLALSVVTYHVAAQTGSAAFPYPLVPVPSFLAISGFVILKSWRSSEGPLHFWIKRATRLLPAFIISFALVYALYGPASTARAFATYYKVGTMNTLNTMNPPLWTLSAEEIFYIVLAFCAAFITSRRLFIPVILAFAGYLYFSGYLGWNDRYVALVPAFLLGLYASETNYRLPLGPIIPTVLACGLAFWVNAPNHFGTMAYALWTCCSVFATLELGRMAWTPIPKGITDISYGVYIYHYPILLYILGFDLPVWKFYVSAPLIACIFAYVSARFVEQPIIRARKRILNLLSPPRPLPTTEPALSSE
jgi:peptidoglycan/LPS O-acetylase OafA/YrhL